jgi:transposase
MKYTISQFLREFSSDDVCLSYLFKNKCPKCPSKRFYRIKDRPAFICNQGHHIHPLKGTIFEKTRTPLVSWFYVIYLFSVSKNGVAAKEVQRHLGVTYKTAWRMGHQIRKLMKQDPSEVLFGTVEIDELFVGGRRRTSSKRKKVPIYGLIQRGGLAKTFVTDSVNKTTATKILRDHVMYGSNLNTDDATIYRATGRNYNHTFTVHSRFQYVDGDTHTNTIEGSWGQLKRSFHGTYHYVSKRHMQAYVDEFIYRYNHRGDNLLFLMLDSVMQDNSHA